MNVAPLPSLHKYIRRVKRSIQRTRHATYCVDTEGNKTCPPKRQKTKNAGPFFGPWQVMFSLPIPRDQGENLDVPTILKVLGHSAALSDDKVAWAKKEEYQS